MTDLEKASLSDAEQLTEDICTLWKPEEGEFFAGRVLRIVEYNANSFASLIDGMIVRRYDTGKKVFFRKQSDAYHHVPVAIRKGQVIAIKYFGVRVAEITGKPYASYALQVLDNGVDIDVDDEPF
jgi:hypothetical protein